MKFSYLNNKTWEEITRDERFFCAILYNEIKNDFLPFLELLAEKSLITIEDVNVTNWEVAYEVCFYRDYIYSFGYKGHKEISKTKFDFLGKRTFDLCLFSKKKIIILEVKAQQGFDSDQLESFRMDKTSLLNELIGPDIDIKLIGLISSQYKPKILTLANFDLIIRWADISKKYDNKLFLRADTLYRK